MGIKASINKIDSIKKSSSTSSLTTATSTPISPLDIDVEHLETFIFVWLDRLYDENNENIQLRKRLRKYSSYLITFDDLKSCEQWLKARSDDEKILFIVPGELGKKIIPNIHQLKSIIGIYIYCWKPENHQTWAQNYFKIRNVISKSDLLIQQISQDQIYFENIEDSKGIEIFNSRLHTRILDPENSSFLWYKLFLEILISSSYLFSSPSPLPLIQILRRSCSDDQEGLNLIKEFEKIYDKNDPIRWLINNNTPLARFLNKALREQNISMLFYLRFFLIDIYNQLKKHQLQSVLVYKKQIMSLNEIENIQNNINNYLMFNGFLYTSTEQYEFSNINTNDNQYQIVFMEIIAENKDETSSFASIEKMTNIDDEQNETDILFICGSIFKIKSLSKNTNSSWILQLSLVGNKELKILKMKKRKLEENKDLLMIVDLLDQSNQSDKANIYCQHLLRELPPDHPLVPQIKEKMNSNTIIKPVSLQRVQFILVDLSTHLTPLASIMLDTLRRLTNDCLLICDTTSNIDFNKMLNKTILLFASNQAISSMTKKPTQVIQYFILEDNKNPNDQPGRFTDIEDLMFQLADELYRCYKWESKEDSRSGDSSLANDKDELANQIHSELKKVYQNVSTDDYDTKPSICALTTIIYLKSRYNHKDSMGKIENLLKDIVSSFLIFDDEEECYNHVCTTDYESSVFIIIDSDYRDGSVVGLKLLSNVKQIYHYNSSPSSIEETTNDKHNNYVVRLVNDLISHYNQLGTEYEEKNDPNNAKDMFLKARKLCELLIKF